jgi:tRNA 2-selenouridine synthase
MSSRPSRRVEFNGIEAVDSIDVEQWDWIVDVRSPTEFAEDHVIARNVVNLPVLDDAERCSVGTLHATNPFEARKLGATLVSQNIAHVLRNHFMTLTRDQRVLVYAVPWSILLARCAGLAPFKPSTFRYCWRGGERSKSLAHILSRIGFSVGLVRKGYKQYRAQACSAHPMVARTKPSM